MGFDLTRAGWMRRIIKNPLFPAVAQWATMGVFVLLVLYGWNYHGIRGVGAPDPLAYTNITTLFFWVIWLMGLIILVPVIGRLWCTVCPLGYLNDLLARFGFGIRYPRRLKNLYLAGLLLVFYNGMVAFFKINHYPDYTSRLLVGILMVLIGVGCIFRGRIFCGYLCPIGAMIGIYSRVAPWKLDVRDKDVCRECSSKACYLGDKKWYRLSTPVLSTSFIHRRPGCQVDLFPPELSEDPRCVMCTQCIKNCPYDNIRWGTRSFLGGVVAPSIPDLSEAVFIVVMMGVTMGMFTRVWPSFNNLLAEPAFGVISALGLDKSAAGEVIHILWGSVVLPFLVVAGLATVAFFLARSSISSILEPPAMETASAISFGIPNREEKLKKEHAGRQDKKLRISGVFSAFTLSFIPVVLAAHAAFALIKVNEKILYLPGALKDPSGIKFYLAIHDLGFMAAPRELMPLEFVRWVSLGMVASGTVASAYAVNRLAGHMYPDDPSYRRSLRVVFMPAVVGLGVILGVLITKWLF